MRRREKPKIEGWLTVGVRLVGVAQLNKLYTYRIRRGHNLLRGDEVVADTPTGPMVGYVMRIDKVRQDTDANITYKFIERRSVPI